MREGAYRKAIGTLTSGIAAMTPQQNKQWAERLHPPARNSTAALSDAPRREACQNAPGPLDGPSGDSSSRTPGHPLRGVRFGALKAPGPSGMRPEHISELLSVSRRRLASRLLGALGQLLDAVSRGELHAAARWSTFTRTIYIEKKSGPEPRAIKIGEVLRAAAAKRLLRDHI